MSISVIQKWHPLILLILLHMSTSTIQSRWDYYGKKFWHFKILEKTLEVHGEASLFWGRGRSLDQPSFSLCTLIFTFYCILFCFYSCWAVLCLICTPQCLLTFTPAVFVCCVWWAYFCVYLLYSHIYCIHIFY